MLTCLCDAFFGEVGIATVRVLEAVGCEVEFPEEQTCCGQPPFNAGDWEASRKVAHHALRVFEGMTVVVPSGSCAAMMRHGNDLLGIEGTPTVYELAEFLAAQGIATWPPNPVRTTRNRQFAFHRACHSRTLDLHGETLDLHGETLDVHGETLDLHRKTLDLHGETLDLHRKTLDLHGETLDVHGETLDVHGETLDVERKTLDLHRKPWTSKEKPWTSIGGAIGWGSTAESLVASIPGVKLIPFEQEDQCCGFGGAFSSTHGHLSSNIGLEKLRCIQDSGSEEIISGDMGCLMHLNGLILRHHLPLRTRHYAEVLAEALDG